MYIKYVFGFDNGEREVFDLEFDTSGTLVLPPDRSAHPGWTTLSFNQCPNCPLSNTPDGQCPAAVALIDFVSRLGNIVSFETTDLAVLCEERWVGQKTTAQRGMSSLMGLLLATSGCPVTAFMRPMARFHLPLATEIETIYRVVGMYLTAQYFHSAGSSGIDLALAGLIDIYDNLQRVNVAIAKRLRESGEIAEMNALALLDQFAQGIPCSIEDKLPEIRDLFSAYSERRPVSE